MTSYPHGRLSATKAPLLLPPSCPAKFKQAVDAPWEPTRVMNYGSLTHKLVLGEGDDIVVIDAADYKTKDAQIARDTALAQNHIPALPVEAARAQAMADAVHAHPVAGPLLADGHPEHSLGADDPLTGVRLTGRLDWMTMIGNNVTVVDYKTAASADPRTWGRKAFDYGSHIQEAWYTTLLELMEIDTDPRFVFVVQEKEPPFLVSVVEFDPAARRLGRAHMRQAIDLYHRCYTDDFWPGYPHDITAVTLPPWAFRTTGEDR